MSSEETQTVISSEEMDAICKQVLDMLMGNSGYSDTERANLTQAAVTEIITRLTVLNHPFKYIVNAFMHSSDGGYNVSSIAYYDISTDFTHTYRWKNLHIQAVIHIYGIAHPNASD